MNWISVHDRLPKDRQWVLVWYWDDWDIAVFNDHGNVKRFEQPSKSRVIPDVRYWVEVKMPGEE